MGERACICCDRLVLIRDLSPRTTMTAALCSRLVAKASVPPTWSEHPNLQRLAGEYNVSRYFPEFPELETVLLSPRGVAAVPRLPLPSAAATAGVVPSAAPPGTDAAGAAAAASAAVAALCLCEECDGALLKNERGDRPPRYAIANGLAVGRGFFRTLPRPPSLTENKMTALVQLDAYFASVRGGPEQCLRTHVMTFGDAAPAAPADSLPRALDAKSVHIIFAGPFTEKQRLLTMKLCEAQPAMMRQMMDGYHADNHLYRDVVTDEAQLTKEAVEAVGARTTTELEAGRGAAALAMLDDIVDSVRDPLPLGGGGDGNGGGGGGGDAVEAVEYIHRVGVVNMEGDHTQRHAILKRYAEGVFPNAAAAPAPVAAAGTPGSVALVARRSTDIVKTSDPYRNEMAFPHLFPYGRGGYSDEDRRVLIGRAAHHRYLLQLSTRQFSTDLRYSLAAFDELATANMMSNVYIHFKCRPDAAATVGTMTGGQLTDAIRLHVEEGETLRRGERPEAVPSSIPGGREFVRGIEAGTSRMWNSNDETKQKRKEMFALRQELGRAHLFITFSRANKDLVTVSVYAGAGEKTVEAAYEAAASGKSEEELVAGGFLLRDNCIWRQMPLEDVLPSKMKESAAQLKARVGNDPAAAARYYERLVDLFITHVLGWNTALQRSARAGGLFGHTKGFYGGTETQGQVRQGGRSSTTRMLLCCCAAVLLCCCAAALLRCCATVLLRCCASVLLGCCAAGLLGCCASVLLCFCAAVLLFCWAAGLLCCCDVVLLCCCADVLMCCCAAVLLCCCAAVLLCCCAAGLLCCCAAGLLCSSAAVVLCCCGAELLWC